MSALTTQQWRDSPSPKMACPHIVWHGFWYWWIHGRLLHLEVVTGIKKYPNSITVPLHRIPSRPIIATEYPPPQGYTYRSNNLVGMQDTFSNLGQGTVEDQVDVTNLTATNLTLTNWVTIYTNGLSSKGPDNVVPPKVSSKPPTRGQNH